jgi:hypothetical protein
MIVLLVQKYCETSPKLVQATAIFAQAAKEAGVEIVANMSQWNSRSSAKSPATSNH